MDRRSGPSGIASDAISAVTSANTIGSTRKFTSAARLSARPKNSSSCERTCTFSSRKLISATTTTKRIGKIAIVSSFRSRPRSSPIPMPRKLAIRRKLEKKPMYRTSDGIHRMSSSSTNRSVPLVRTSRVRLPPSSPNTPAR